MSTREYLWAVDFDGFCYRLSANDVDAKWRRTESQERFLKVSAAKGYAWAVSEGLRPYVLVQPSETPVRVEEECFENQRWIPMSGYQHVLLPGDPPTWSDSGYNFRPREGISLPSHGWRWDHSWMPYVGGDTDKEGFTYSMNFNRKFFPDKFPAACVRRRRWIRSRTFTETDKFIKLPLPGDFPILDIVLAENDSATSRCVVAWLLTSDGRVLVRSGISRTQPMGLRWLLLENPPGVEFNQVSSSPGSSQLLLTTWDGRLFARVGCSSADVAGTDWLELPTPNGQRVIYAAVGPNVAWATVCGGCKIFHTRLPPAHKDQSSLNWVELSQSALPCVSVTRGNQTYAVDAQGDIVFRTGVTEKELSGRGWQVISAEIDDTPVEQPVDSLQTGEYGECSFGDDDKSGRPEGFLQSVGQAAPGVGMILDSVSQSLRIAKGSVSSLARDLSRSLSLQPQSTGVRVNLEDVVTEIITWKRQDDQSPSVLKAGSRAPSRSLSQPSDSQLSEASETPTDLPESSDTESATDIVAVADHLVARTGWRCVDAGQLHGTSSLPQFLTAVRRSVRFPADAPWRLVVLTALRRLRSRLDRFEKKGYLQVLEKTGYSKSVKVSIWKSRRHADSTLTLNCTGNDVTLDFSGLYVTFDLGFHVGGFFPTGFSGGNRYGLKMVVKQTFQTKDPNLLPILASKEFRFDFFSETERKTWFSTLNSAFKMANGFKGPSFNSLWALMNGNLYVSSPIFSCFHEKPADKRDVQDRRIPRAVSEQPNTVTTTFSNDTLNRSASAPKVRNVPRLIYNDAGLEFTSKMDVLNNLNLFAVEGHFKDISIGGGGKLIWALGHDGNLWVYTGFSSSSESEVTDSMVVQWCETQRWSTWLRTWSQYRIPGDVPREAVRLPAPDWSWSGDWAVGDDWLYAKHIQGPYGPRKSNSYFRRRAWLRKQTIKYEGPWSRLDSPPVAHLCLQPDFNCTQCADENPCFGEDCWLKTGSDPRLCKNLDDASQQGDQEETSTYGRAETQSAGDGPRTDLTAPKFVANDCGDRILESSKPSHSFPSALAIVTLRDSFDVLCRLEVTPKQPIGSSWFHVEGKMRMVAMGPQRRLWGLDPKGHVWRRDTSPVIKDFLEYSWIPVDQMCSFEYLAVGAALVLVLDSKGTVHYRAGIARGNPSGVKWIPALNEVRHVTIRQPRDQIWAVLEENDTCYLARRLGQEFSPVGTGWERIGAARWDSLAVGPQME